MKQPALFPPGWLEHTSSCPTRAAREIERLTIELNRVQDENSSVRRRKDELECERERVLMLHDATCRRLQSELEREQRAVRASKSMLADAERRLSGYRQLSDVEMKKARDAESALIKEKSRVSSLERRVRKLERAVFQAGAHRDAVRLVSAIQKLAASPAGKRLASACHPDKVPVEVSESGIELFRFVQNIRESGRI